MSTPDTTQSSKSKPPMMIIGLLVVVIGAVAWLFFGSNNASGGMATDHAAYYPEQTTFFAEVSGSDAMATKMLKAFDSLRQEDRHFPKGTEEIELSSLYEKDFKPMMSLGFWGFKSQQPFGPKTPESFLFTVSTKDGVTMDSLMADFKMPKESYTLTKTANAEVVSIKTPEASPEAPPQGKHPEPLMALSSGHFIFASSKTVMDEALSTEKTKKTILDNPFFKANLHHLPSQRQGTFLISSTGMQSNDLNDPSLKPLLDQDPSIKKNLENSVSLSNAIPGSVSALKIQGDQLITIDSYSPIDFSKIENAPLKDAFKGFITNSATYDLPTVLPKSTIALVGMTNLSQFYDLYMTHLATDAQKAKISTTENQLKLMRIDLRKDIVSCLDGKAGFGIVGNEGTSPDYLVFLNTNEGTKKVMEQVSALATTIAQATKTEKSMNSGAHTMTLLESPRSPIKLAYGDIMKDAMAIGTAPGVENIYTTQQNASTSLNNSPLFKTLMGDSPNKVSGFLFLNVQEGRALLEKLVAQRGGAGAPQMAVLNFLKGIDGVYAISYPENDALLRGHFAIKLAAPTP